jgi:hypothetical protein
LRDPYRRLVEHHVDVLHQPRYEAAIANVALDDANRSGGQRRRQVLTPAADKVVEHDNFLSSGLDQLIYQMRPNGPSAARHQGARTLQRTSSHAD